LIFFFPFVFSLDRNLSDFYVYNFVSCSMIAGFGSGAAFSIVSGMGGGSLTRQAAFAVSSGFFFAALRGGLFQVLELPTLVKV
jgi:hypothetical protein